MFAAGVPGMAANCHPSYTIWDCPTGRAQPSSIESLSALGSRRRLDSTRSRLHATVASGQVGGHDDARPDRRGRRVGVPQDGSHEREVSQHHEDAVAPAVNMTMRAREDMCNGVPTRLPGSRLLTLSGGDGGR